MDAPTDVFDHDLHAERMGGNEGCARCHPDPDEPRTREGIRSCATCHSASGEQALWRMIPEGSTAGLGTGMAPSYVDAMHGTCVACHRQQDERRARCPACHRSEVD